MPKVTFWNIQEVLSERLSRWQPLRWELRDIPQADSVVGGRGNGCQMKGWESASLTSPLSPSF